MALRCDMQQRARAAEDVRTLLEVQEDEAFPVGGEADRTQDLVPDATPDDPRAPKHRQVQTEGQQAAKPATAERTAVPETKEGDPPRSAGEPSPLAQWNQPADRTARSAEKAPCETRPAGSVHRPVVAAGVPA
jgi:hypothetical protein